MFNKFVALAPKDEHGFFYPKDVVAPLRLITGTEYKIPSFARHLKSFCEQSRGPILQRRGKPYRFIRPIMEPYVVLRGLADELITGPGYDRFGETVRPGL